jgi:hypothetical protein
MQAVGAVIGSPARPMNLKDSAESRTGQLPWRAGTKVPRIRRSRTSPAGRPHRVSTVITHALLASKKPRADTLTLPLDFYKLLEVNSGASKDTISFAFERCALPRLCLNCDHYLTAQRCSMFAGC